MTRMVDGVVEVHAIADRDGDTWRVEVCEPGSPFLGLFAWGPTLNDARESVAVLVWADIRNRCPGLAVDPREVRGIRILATTRKTFSVEALSGATS